MINSLSVGVQKMDGLSQIIQLSQAKNETGSLIQDQLPPSSLAEAQCLITKALGTSKLTIQSQVLANWSVRL